MNIRRVTSYIPIIPVVLLLSYFFATQAVADPNIKIVLQFDKDYYGFDEPINAKVSIRNFAAENYLTGKGFNTRNPALELRIIDPAKNLLKLIPKDRLQTETPDTPPLPHVQTPNGLIEAVPCERLKAELSSGSTDLRGNFDFTLPGVYSAQVQRSAVLFKNSPNSVCDVKNPAWVGVLKSNTVYFFAEGKTPVTITPTDWQMAWQHDFGNMVGTVEVAISPRPGVPLGDYDPTSIRLNNIKPIGDVQYRSNLLLVRFSRSAALASLAQPVQNGQQYPIVISGRLKNGTPFGGARRIMVRNAAPLTPQHFKVE